MNDPLIERMTEIAHRDSAVSVTVRADDLRALLSKLRAPVADERPLGAIINGRTLAERLEAYPFESEGGYLHLCSDWVEFRRCFEYLAELASAYVADERAAFEAARQKRDPDAPLGRMCLINNDEYSSSEDQAAWEGWQARAALASAPATCDHQFHFFGDQRERRCNRCGVIESKASAPVADEREAFHVELSPEQEEQFSKWVGVEKMTPWQRSVARLAKLLNTTNRGLIDYGAAQHFADELMSRAGLTSAPVADNKMRNPNLSRQGGWINTDGFCDFLILAGIIGAIVGGILVPEVISFLWDFAKPWIHEATK